MKTKILIIDDEEQDRKGMAIALKKEGYSNVSTAATDKEGLKIAESFNPDIILIDVVLKGIDGFEVCKKIKAAEGAIPKVIMITAHLDAINARKARHSGADEIIEKIPGFKNITKTIDTLAK